MGTALRGRRLLSRRETVRLFDHHTDLTPVCSGRGLREGIIGYKIKKYGIDSERFRTKT